MASNAVRAQVVLGVLAGLLLLGALVGVIGAFFFGAGSPLFALANVGLVAWLAIGLMQRKERVWMAILLYGGSMAAFQLSLGIGTRDPMALVVGVVNAAIVALLIWAGRNLPDESAPATAAA